MPKKEKIEEQPQPSIMSKVGPWAFIIGLLIAVLTGGFIKPTAMMVWFLAVLGLVVGLLNITESELKTYLLATIAFLVSSSSLTNVVAGIPVIGVTMVSYMAPIVTNIVIFIAPGAAVVALKALYSISRN
jgi:hypothetical protein